MANIILNQRSLKLPVAVGDTGAVLGHSSITIFRRDTLQLMYLVVNLEEDGQDQMLLKAADVISATDTAIYVKAQDGNSADEDGILPRDQFMQLIGISAVQAGGLKMGVVDGVEIDGTTHELKSVVVKNRSGEKSFLRENITVIDGAILIETSKRPRQNSGLEMELDLKNKAKLQRGITLVPNLNTDPMPEMEHLRATDGGMNVGAAPAAAEPVTPVPLAPMTPEPIAPLTPEPIAPLTPEPIAPLTPEPVAPIAAEPAAQASISIQPESAKISIEPEEDDYSVRQQLAGIDTMIERAKARGNTADIAKLTKMRDDLKQMAGILDADDAAHGQGTAQPGADDGTVALNISSGSGMALNQQAGGMSGILHDLEINDLDETQGLADLSDTKISLDKISFEPSDVQAIKIDPSDVGSGGAASPQGLDNGGMNAVSTLGTDVATVAMQVELDQTMGAMDSEIEMTPLNIQKSHVLTPAAETQGVQGLQGLQVAEEPLSALEISNKGESLQPLELSPTAGTPAEAGGAVIPPVEEAPVTLSPMGQAVQEPKQEIDMQVLQPMAQAEAVQTGVSGEGASAAAAHVEAPAPLESMPQTATAVPAETVIPADTTAPDTAAQTVAATVQPFTPEPMTPVAAAPTPTTVEPFVSAATVEPETPVTDIQLVDNPALAQGSAIQDALQALGHELKESLKSGSQADQAQQTQIPEAPGGEVTLHAAGQAQGGVQAQSAELKPIGGAAPQEAGLGLQPLGGQKPTGGQLQQAGLQPLGEAQQSLQPQQPQQPQIQPIKPQASVQPQLQAQLQPQIQPMKPVGIQQPVQQGAIQPIQGAASGTAQPQPQQSQFSGQLQQGMGQQPGGLPSMQRPQGSTAQTIQMPRVGGQSTMGQPGGQALQPRAGAFAGGVAGAYAQLDEKTMSAIDNCFPAPDTSALYSSSVSGSKKAGKKNKVVRRGKRTGGAGIVAQIASGAAFAAIFYVLYMFDIFA